ncbi:MAG: hypothetical protein QOJ42_3702 [Acidobacteriaceae bacterium]|jgi:hypothetical protein|nr:hypothetical protein [Acidobacteriaceae bacterium]
MGPLGLALASMRWRLRLQWCRGYFGVLETCLWVACYARG